MSSVIWTDAKMREALNQRNAPVVMRMMRDEYEARIAELESEVKSLRSAVVMAHEVECSLEARLLDEERLLAIANRIHDWLGKNQAWDLHYEPPWYQEFREVLAVVNIPF